MFTIGYLLFHAGLLLNLTVKIFLDKGHVPVNSSSEILPFLRNQ
jgi:hypothetical protein